MLNQKLIQLSQKGLKSKSRKIQNFNNFEQFILGYKVELIGYFKKLSQTFYQLEISGGHVINIFETPFEMARKHSINNTYCNLAESFYLLIKEDKFINSIIKEISESTNKDFYKDLLEAYEFILSKNKDDSSLTSNPFSIQIEDNLHKSKYNI